jgi:hypothetical protein
LASPERRSINPAFAVASVVTVWPELADDTQAALLTSLALIEIADGIREEPVSAESPVPAVDRQAVPLTSAEKPRVAGGRQGELVP